MIKTYLDLKNKTFERIVNKNKDNNFINFIVSNSNLSMFETKAVFEEFKKQYLMETKIMQQYQMKIMATKIDVSSRVEIKQQDLKEIIITLHDEEDEKIRFNIDLFREKFKDMKIPEKNTTTAVRRNKLHRISYEAYKKNCVLTVEDFAYKIFNCGERTIVRDIEAFRNIDVFIPLRGQVKDIGKSITHKVKAINKFIEGKEAGEIARIINHSITSVERYIEKFKQIILCLEKGLKDPEISFLTSSSYTLIEEYKKIYFKLKQENKLQFIEELLKNDIKFKKKYIQGK